MTGPSGDHDPSGRFVRGLTLGALLGAVIAGSSIWTRARARRRSAGRIVVPDETPVAAESSAASEPPSPAEPTTKPAD